MSNPKAMTASSHIESAGKFEGSRANVMVRPCVLLCACTDRPFSIVYRYSVVRVFLAVLFSSFLRTFTDAHRLVDMTIHPRRFDRFGSRHTLRKTVTRICHSICHRQTQRDAGGTEQHQFQPSVRTVSIALGIVAGLTTSVGSMRHQQSLI